MVSAFEKNIYTILFNLRAYIFKCSIYAHTYKCLTMVSAFEKKMYTILITLLATKLKENIGQ